MKQEDKKLLLKDLCSRLPYGVKIQHGDNYRPIQLWNIAILELGTYNMAYYNNGLNNNSYSVVKIKPYLRSMSSMTEEEKEELYHYYCKEIADNLNSPNLTWELRCCISNSFGTDWLNAHHFDYRGLIKKGLALPAPEGMYKIDLLWYRLTTRRCGSR